MNRLVLHALGLVCVTVLSAGCAPKESPVVLPATAPTPPSTTPPRSDLTDERRREVIERRPAAAKLPREERRRSRAPATRTAPATAPG